MSDTNCPSREQLYAYLVGTLLEDEAEGVLYHLSSCPACQKTLETFDEAEDTLVARLRTPAVADPYVEEAQYQAAAARVEAMMGGPVVGGTGATDSVSDASSPLGELGEYQLLEKLGEGGMGAVYKALQTKLDKVVALKVLSKGRMGDERAIARFEREMKAVGRLNHPNIVGALDAREIEGTHVLVMEYVEGMNLAELVRRLGPLPISEACELICQAACGFQYAHEHGLIHRDIKPSNLMLSAEGQVKILDLGLALLAADQPNGKEMTGTGQAMGTADYMAPEQTFDSHQVDIRADIYSLGCTLYKLLSGHAPFSGPEYSSNMAKMLAHVQNPIPSIRQFRDDIPPELSAVLDRMLAKEPDERFGTPGEVVTALEAFTTDCNPAGLLEKAQQAARAAAVADKSLASTEPYHASAFVGTEPSHVPQIQPTFVPRRRRPKLWPVAIGLLPLAIVFGIVIWVNRTRLEVPEGTELQISKDGEVRVTVPGDKQRVVRPRPVSIGLKPKPLTPETGRPLSRMALVTEPAAIKGSRSWTIESLGHRGQVMAVAYSPAGRLLASAGYDGTIRLWEPTTGRLVRALVGQEDVVDAIAWSPDGKMLLAGSRYDESVRIWDVQVGRVVQTFDTGKEVVAQAVAWSPDGTSVASVAGNLSTIGIWDMRSGETLYTLKGHADTINAMAWSPDGKIIASGSRDKTINLWDAGSGRLLRSITGHTDGVCAIAWSPDGKTLASGSRDSTLRLWDVVSGQSRRVVKPDMSYLFAVAWSPDGKLVAANGAYKIGLWDAESGEQVRVLDWPEGMARIQGLAWSPDGHQIASGAGSGDLRLWDVNTGEPMITRRGHVGEMRALAWSPNGRTVADGTYTRVTLWELASGKRLRTIGADHWVQSLAWSPDSTTVAAGTTTKTIEVQDAASGRKLRTLCGHTDFVQAVTWSPDGNRLASRGRDGTARIWDAQSGRLLHALNAGSSYIHVVAWSPDGKRLASSGRRAARIWDAESGRLLHSFEAQGDRVSALAWSLDGTTLAIAADESNSTRRPYKISFYRCDGNSYRLLNTLAGLGCGTLSLAWSPNSKTVCSAHVEGISLVEPESGSRVSSVHPYVPIFPPGPDFRGVSSPDLSAFAYPGMDGAIRVFDVATGRPLRVMVHLPADHYLTVTPEGHYRGSPGVEEGLVYVVQTDTGQETFAPDEFTKKYGWKNDPAKVQVQGKKAAGSGQQPVERGQ